MLADLDGQPFLTWEDFCQYPEPYGLGLSPEQVEVILDRANAERCMGELLGWGGDRRSARARVDQGYNITLKTKRGNSAAYLEARLEKLAREGGNPVRTLELLFAVLDEAEDKELAGRIRRHLRKHGITRDSVEVAAARPLPNPVIGKGMAGPGRGKKTGDDGTRFNGTTNTYLAARLKRDRPDLAEEVQAGRMSIRAAARGQDRQEPDRL